jgi:sulfur carrier protein
MSRPIQIHVNGEPREVPEGTSVEALLAALGLPRDAVAVERNARLVRKQERESTLLAAGDQIEIVTLVGGG